MGGIVRRSLAMVFLGCGATIAKAYSLDDATRLRRFVQRNDVEAGCAALRA